MLKTWVSIHPPNSPHVHGLQCTWHSCLQKYHDVHVYFLFLMIQSIIIHYIPASTHSHRQFIMYHTARVNFLKHATNHVTALPNACSWLPISIKVRIFSVHYVSKLVYHVYRPRNLPSPLSLEVPPTFAYPKLVLWDWPRHLTWVGLLLMNLMYCDQALWIQYTKSVSWSYLIKFFNSDFIPSVNSSNLGKPHVCPLTVKSFVIKGLCFLLRQLSIFCICFWLTPVKTGGKKRGLSGRPSNCSACLGKFNQAHGESHQREELCIL